MEKIRILNLEPKGYSQKATAVLKEFAEVEEGPLTHEELMENIARFNALIVRFGHGIIGQELMGRGKLLKAIGSATTGLNHIDLDVAKERNIAVLSLQGETEFLQDIHATPEHTWALLLSLIRNIPDAVMHVREGGWDRDLFKGTELHEKTLGIVGFGRVGSKLAKYAQSFGMEVLAHDEREVSAPDYVTFVPLEELFKRSDVVSVNVPYNDATHHMIGQDAIALMKKGVILVNTSRGEVLDENALLKALESKHIGGSALDVLEGEHSKEKGWVMQNPLVEYTRSHHNLLITPHIAGATAE
ncbi:MAG: NAD(P)-dependent oxidoreductase, partial [bacterium]|nr:NAD(P)-dependent oxidoreductase [bacterium]